MKMFNQQTTKQASIHEYFSSTTHPAIHGTSGALDSQVNFICLMSTDVTNWHENQAHQAENENPEKPVGGKK